MPSSPSLPSGSTRGWAAFRDSFTRDTTYLSVGSTGPGALSGLLFAGTYDVEFETTSDSNLVGLPRSAKTTLAKGRVLASGQTFNANLEVHTVSGVLTVQGNAMPNSPNLPSGGSRGWLELFHRDTSDSTFFSVGTTGPAAYSGLLFGGTYDVFFETTSDSNLQGMPRSARTRLATGHTVSAQPFGWNLAVVNLSGAVSINSGAMPNSPNLPSGGARGWITFRHRFTGDTTSLSVGPTGPAAFSGVLFAGVYDVLLETTSDSNLLGLPRSALAQLAKGCLPAGSCTASAADLTGAWTFVFDNGLWGVWSMSLYDNAGALAGNYTAPNYSGRITSGSHSGSNIAFDATSPGCRLVLTGQVVDACQLTGYGECVGYNNTNFFAVR